MVPTVHGKGARMTNVIRFPRSDDRSPVWDRNYSDIRDAFGVAALRFVAWEKDTEAIFLGDRASLRTAGLDHDYPDEPTVKLNGKDRAISEIFRLGQLINEPIPPMLAHAIAMARADIEAASEDRCPSGATYAQAAEVLLDYVEGVLETQQDAPLPHRPLGERR
jgi:hypothetical protein